jgi:hypothetical protein
MAKQSVLEMLKRPIVQKPEEVKQSYTTAAERALDQLVMEHIQKKATDDAVARFSTVIAEIEGRANSAEADRDQMKARAELLDGMIEEFKATVNGLNAKVEIESKAKDAANAACGAEREKSRSLENQVMMLTGRVTELGNVKPATEKNSLLNINVGKKQDVKIPEFNFEVVSRDLNGAIKTISIKPKQ